MGLVAFKVAAYYKNCLFEKKSHRHGEDQEEVVVVKAKRANDPSARNGVDDHHPSETNKRVAKHSL